MDFASSTRAKIERGCCEVICGAASVGIDYTRLMQQNYHYKYCKNKRCEKTRQKQGKL